MKRMGVTADVSLRAKLESIGTNDRMVVFPLDEKQDYKIFMRSIGVLKCRGGRFGEAVSSNNKVFVVGSDYMRIGILVSVSDAPVPVSEVRNKKYRRKVKRSEGTWHSLITKIFTVSVGEFITIITDNVPSIRTALNHAQEDRLLGRKYRTEAVHIVVPIRDEMLNGVMITREK